MAFVTARSIVEDFLRDFNMSVEAFANLQFENPRIPHWIIRRIIHGERTLDELHEGPRLIRLVQACRAFQKSMPVDVDWSDPRVRNILARDYQSSLEAPQPFIPDARA